MLKDIKNVELNEMELGQVSGGFSKKPRHSKNMLKNLQRLWEFLFG